MLHLSDFYTVIVITCAIALDILLGEPKHYHPLVYFGRFANRLENWLSLTTNASQNTSKPPVKHSLNQKWRGVIALCLAVLPLVFLLLIIEYFASPTAATMIAIDILILYLAIGNTSLRQHALQVHQALQRDNIAQARQRVAMLVSRDTEAMEKQQVTHATIESVLENGSDAVFAALFWFLIAGAPGVVLYRLSNTLDAMWGYKNSRYLHFGWATAKWDDLLNWLPARLSALTYALLGNTRKACASWIAQAKRWESPNAGSVMAAGAASLGITLGGAASYHGETKHRPLLGQGKKPVADDIIRACRLVQYGIALWIFIIILGSLAIA